MGKVETLEKTLHRRAGHQLPPSDRRWQRAEGQAPGGGAVVIRPWIKSGMKLVIGV